MPRLTRCRLFWRQQRRAFFHTDPQWPGIRQAPGPPRKFGPAVTSPLGANPMCFETRRRYLESLSPRAGSLSRNNRSLRRPATGRLPRRVTGSAARSTRPEKHERLRATLPPAAGNRIPSRTCGHWIPARPAELIIEKKKNSFAKMAPGLPRERVNSLKTTQENNLHAVAKNCLLNFFRRSHQTPPLSPSRAIFLVYELDG